MLFGPSSEKDDGTSDEDDDPDSAKNDVESEDKPPTKSSGDATEQAKKPKKPRGKRGRQKLDVPDFLRRVPKTIEPDGGSLCECGGSMRKIGEETTERLGYKPSEVFVIEESRPKYVCRCCDRFRQAKATPRIFESSKYDDSLVSGILVGKFADFLPNYRQQQIFLRAGVQFADSTMSRLTTRAVEALQPVYDLLKEDLLSSSKLFMDETRIPQLLPGNGKTKTCWAWALCRDDRRWLGNERPGVIFD